MTSRQTRPRPALRHVVYELSSPLTEVFYVGITDDEDRRAEQHQRELHHPGPNSSGDPRLERFRQIRESGETLYFDVVERYASKFQAVHAERKLIARLRAQGVQLVNVQNARAPVKPKSFLVAVGGDLRAAVEAYAEKEGQMPKRAALDLMRAGLEAVGK